MALWDFYRELTVFNLNKDYYDDAEAEDIQPANMIDVSSIFNINHITSYNLALLMKYLTNSSLANINVCLQTCSNKGQCMLTNSLTFECICHENFKGSLCQLETSLCSEYKCLNNGECIEYEGNVECVCQELFYGDHCEHYKDVCANNTCVAKQGYCYLNDSLAACKCYQYFYGENCELQSQILAVQKTIISLSTLITLIIFVLFAFIIILFDIHKFFILKPSKRVIRINNMTFSQVRMFFLLNK